MTRISHNPCAEFCQRQHHSINASQPQQLVLCPRNLAYLSLMAKAVPFGKRQQIHFSGGLEHLGKNVFLLRPIRCSRCYLSYSKDDTVAHHRENRIPTSALTHAKKTQESGSTPFSTSSLRKKREMEWRMWHKAGMHCTELKLREVKNSKECIMEISGTYKSATAPVNNTKWHQGKQENHDWLLPNLLSKSVLMRHLQKETTENE